LTVELNNKWKHSLSTKNYSQDKLKINRRHYKVRGAAKISNDKTLRATVKIETKLWYLLATAKIKQLRSKKCYKGSTRTTRTQNRGQELKKKFMELKLRIE
jgi:hypothetical protein